MFGYKPYQLALRSIIAISFFWWMASLMGLMLKSFGIAFHHMTNETLMGCFLGNLAMSSLAFGLLAMIDESSKY